MLYKDYWDNLHWRILKSLENPDHDSDVVAMVMDEGVAHLCFVKSSITVIK